MRKIKAQCSFLDVGKKILMAGLSTRTTQYDLLTSSVTISLTTIAVVSSYLWKKARQARKLHILDMLYPQQMKGKYDNEPF